MSEDGFLPLDPEPAPEAAEQLGGGIFDVAEGMADGLGVFATGFVEGATEAMDGVLEGVSGIAGGIAEAIDEDGQVEPALEPPPYPQVEPTQDAIPGQAVVADAMQGEDVSTGADDASMAAGGEAATQDVFAPANATEAEAQVQEIEAEKDKDVNLMNSLSSLRHQTSMDMISDIGGQ